MQAKVGDRLVVKGHHMGEPDRDGEILEVHGERRSAVFRPVVGGRSRRIGVPWSGRDDRPSRDDRGSVTW